MRKLTKLQADVLSKKESLNPLKDKVFKYAEENVFINIGTTKYSKTLCLECGTDFNASSKNVKCPSCKKKLKIIPMNKSSDYEYGFCIVIDAHKEYQVIRYIQVEKTWRKNRSCKTITFECMQKWINKKGKETILATRLLSGFNYMSKGVRFANEELKIANNSYSKDNILGPIYTKRKGSKLTIRNGYKYSLYNIKAEKFFKLILTNPKFETLLKSKETGLFKLFSDRSDLNNYWPQIKIALKNNYKISNAGDWIDMIDMLRSLGKDTNSPKYICPDNLESEHQRWNRKRTKVLKEQRKNELRNEMERDDRIYKKEMANYMDLRIENQKLIIQPIQSVEQLFEDSTTLKHCAFNNQYHKKKNRLLMRATVDKSVVETIELDLIDFKIIQARGYQNKASKYNEQIKESIKDNIEMIKEIKYKDIKNVA
jgi:hypothetical protein